MPVMDICIWNPYAIEGRLHYLTHTDLQNLAPCKLQPVIVQQPTMASACVSQRCGFCGFQLQNGDKIVASKSMYCIETYFFHVLLANISVVTDDGHSSGEMSNHLAMDDEFGEAFEQCLGACSHLDGRAVGCHAACANYIPPPSRASSLQVSAYQYEPSPADVVRRLRWLRLQWISTPILRHAKPPLPQEIRLQVAKHLLQGTALYRYATVRTSNHARPKRTGQHCSSHIHLVSTIWANFTKFEGVQYISSLSNVRDEDHAEAIFTPCSSKLVDTLYIAENYLGVLQILFCNSIQTPAIESSETCWWRIVRVSEQNTMLVAQTDVSLLDLLSICQINKQ